MVRENNVRALAALFLAVGACSPPAQEGDEPSAPAPAEHDVEAARSFVLTNVNQSSRLWRDDSGVVFRVGDRVENLDLGSTWRWDRTQDFRVSGDSESQTLAAYQGKSDRTLTEEVSVDPRRLSYPVEWTQESGFLTNLWAVKIQCAEPSCISLGTAGGTEQANYTWWTFDSEQGARRVARALSVLIETEGGRRTQF